MKPRPFLAGGIEKAILKAIRFELKIGKDQSSAFKPRDAIIREVC